jgi:recombination protein RecT
MTQLQLPAQVSQLRADLGRMTREFETVLPSQIPPDRFIRTIVTAVQMQPELATADRKTLISACMKAAQDGLLIDGREAGLSVYKDRKTGGTTVAYLPMVGGILKKVRQSGEISSIRAHVVYQGDEFDFELGDDERIHHKPNLAQQGSPVAVYAIAKFKDGDIQREVMSVAQVQKIRAKSTGIGKACWDSEWGEMAKKTVIRRLAKRLPSSNDLDQVLQSDNALTQGVAPVVVSEEQPAMIEAQVTVADLNRQIAAAPTQAAAVSESDSGEESTVVDVVDDNQGLPEIEPSDAKSDPF